MNSMVLVGTVTRTPSVRFEGDGLQMASLTLALVESGREGKPYTLYVPCEAWRRTFTAQRQPWLVAFSFGLLHGLGSAGVLSEAGLPEGHIPLALLLYSVGVEFGHFAFIAVVIAAIRLGRWAVGRLSPTALNPRRAALSQAKRRRTQGG